MRTSHLETGQEIVVIINTVKDSNSQMNRPWHPDTDEVPPLYLFIFKIWKKSISAILSTASWPLKDKSIS